MKVYYDVSRLMERAAAPSPTGVDRVDLRYALWTREQASTWHALTQRPEGLSLLDDYCVDNLLTSLQQRWILGARDPEKDALYELPEFWALEGKLSVLEKAARVSLRERLDGRARLEWPFYIQPEWSRRLIRMRRKPIRVCETFDPQGLYFNIGHNFRFKKAAEAISKQFVERSVIFMHDVIPLLYPETQRAISQQHFRCFCEWVDRLNGQLIVSSQSTIADLNQLRGRGLDLFGTHLGAIIQLPLPVEPSFAQASVACSESMESTDPYFLMLGTWEPRKNFDLLLDVWERLVATGNPRALLKWVGRRSEISPRSVKRLERLKAMGWIEELGVVSDVEIRELFSSAQSLLFPSLAEGWGLPLAEALAAGLPVIASDLPICREVSQGLAEYLDPLRPELWLQSVSEFAIANSEARNASKRRIRSFQTSTWEAYFNLLSLDRLASISGASRNTSF